MKNQYFGDIGDYGKYGLLRHLAKDGIRIAVNWYLSEDDGSNDGNQTSYLDKISYRRFDSELYDVLKELVSLDHRNVISFEAKRMIPNASYYSFLLDNTGTRAERLEKRKEWHEEALRCCDRVDLVYLDPDTGLMEADSIQTKKLDKYCFPEEVADYYNAGHDVIYYCQKGRRTYEQWEEAKTYMQSMLPDAKIVAISFHKGTCRAYIFVLHEEHYTKYSESLRRFLLRWGKMFTEELKKNKPMFGKPTGNEFTVTDKNGVSVHIQECDDGWVELRFSNEKNTYRRISIDHFISRLR